MNRRFAALAIAGLPIIAFAGGFRNAALSNDASHLVISPSSGQRFDAPKSPDQVAYGSPYVSHDGRYVGWLALYPNCCTSYPIALRLVVLDRSRRMHTFEGDKLAISGWCFTPNPGAVAYAQGVLHGSDYRHFELRGILDGDLRASFDYPGTQHGDIRAHKRAPAWVRCVPE